MTYILIWIIFAPTFGNVAATSSAEFNNLSACERARQTIMVHPTGSRIEIAATCHEKGQRQ